MLTIFKSFRSVHNIRIERLWFDFTAGIGSKWKMFFQELEYQAELDVDLPSHIWLIHYLFLDSLNQDIITYDSNYVPVYYVVVDAANVSLYTDTTVEANDTTLYRKERVS